MGPHQAKFEKWLADQKAKDPKFSFHCTPNYEYMKDQNEQATANGRQQSPEEIAIRVEKFYEELNVMLQAIEEGRTEPFVEDIDESEFVAIPDGIVPTDRAQVDELNQALREGYSSDLD